MLPSTHSPQRPPHNNCAYRVQGLYLVTSRELKRLDALAFSPIFQHYAESLTGLHTIRAFQRQDLFQDINRVRLDNGFALTRLPPGASLWGCTPYVPSSARTSFTT